MSTYIISLETKGTTQPLLQNANDCIITMLNKICKLFFQKILIRIRMIYFTQRRKGKILFFLFGYSEICDQSFSNRKGAKKKINNFLVWPFRNLLKRLDVEIPIRKTNCLSPVKRDEFLFFRNFGG
jgi:hypothetical protein